MQLVVEEAAVAAAGPILAARTGWTGLPPTAQALLGAAVESFGERGYHATTLKHIAAGSGLSTAALYVHFRSKEQLLFEISRSGHEEVLAVVEAAAALDGPELAFATLVYAFTRWHTEHDGIARVVQYERGALGPESRRPVDALRRRIEQITRETIARAVGGEPDAPGIRGAAIAVLSLGIDTARWYRPGGAYTPDALGRLYCGLARRMIGLD